MHTDTKDMHGQDLERIIGHLGLTNGEVIFSTQKISPMHLSLVYNIADCTINVSDAEGFGLATLESLSCETPIIATMTGGLQEQVTDGEEWFGVGLEPASKAVIGSQDIPYIFEDRLRGDDVVDALEKSTICRLKSVKSLAQKAVRTLIKIIALKNTAKNGLILLMALLRSMDHGKAEKDINLGLSRR